MIRKIQRAIAACRAVGMELSVLEMGLGTLNNHWICQHGWIHPLAAVVLVDQPPVEYATPLEQVVANHFQTKYHKDTQWFESMIQGIAGSKCYRTLDKEIWRLGKSLRRQYKLWEIYD